MEHAGLLDRGRRDARVLESIDEATDRVAEHLVAAEGDQDGREVAQIGVAP